VETFLFTFSPYIIFSDCELLITGFQKIAIYNNFTY
jgi:hypothetical protein